MPDFAPSSERPAPRKEFGNTEDRRWTWDHWGWSGTAIPAAQGQRKDESAGASRAGDHTGPATAGSLARACARRRSSVMDDLWGDGWRTEGEYEEAEDGAPARLPSTIVLGFFVLIFGTALLAQPTQSHVFLRILWFACFLSARRP